MDKTPDPMAQIEAAISAYQQASMNGSGRDEYAALLALIRSALAAQPRQGEQYLVIGYGESDIPDMVIVNGRDGVREGIARMCWSDPKDAHPEELDGHMEGFDDAYEWQWNGYRYDIEFEIGGIEITKLNAAPPIPTHASSLAVSDEAVMRAKFEAWYAEEYGAHNLTRDFDAPGKYKGRYCHASASDAWAGYRAALLGEGA